MRGYRLVCTLGGVGCSWNEYQTLQEALDAAKDKLAHCMPDGSSQGYPEHITTLKGKLVLDKEQLAERLGRKLIRVVHQELIWET